MSFAILIEHHAAVWARCNSQWARGRADDDDVAAMGSAATELENATPVTVEEWRSKWRALAAYRKALEFDIGPDDIEKMLAEFAEVTRCTPL
jgi:hypothetical protein